MTLVLMGLSVLAVVVAGSVLARAARVVIDRLAHDPYVPEPRYRYRPGIEEADVHLINRIGQRRFEQVQDAQERCTRAERLKRRLAERRRRRAGVKQRQVG